MNRFCAKLYFMWKNVVAQRERRRIGQQSTRILRLHRQLREQTLEISRLKNQSLLFEEALKINHRLRTAMMQIGRKADRIGRLEMEEVVYAMYLASDLTYQSYEFLDFGSKFAPKSRFRVPPSEPLHPTLGVN